MITLVFCCLQKRFSHFMFLPLSRNSFFYTACSAFYFIKALFIAQGQSIIPMLTGEVIPVMELLSSMKSHSVPEKIDVSLSVSCFMKVRSSAIQFLFFFFLTAFGKINYYRIINWYPFGSSAAKRSLSWLYFADANMWLENISTVAIIF